MTAQPTYPLMLWTSVQNAAAVLAATDGVTSNRFIVHTEEQLVGIIREAGVPGTEIRAVIFVYDVVRWSRFRDRSLYSC